MNIAAGAFHLRRTLNGWSSYLPPHYPELTDAMERFPDARSLALAQGAGVDVVLVDRAGADPGARGGARGRGGPQTGAGVPDPLSIASSRRPAASPASRSARGRCRDDTA